ncbi:MAG: restriction endonuclease subunit S, partial [Acidimicrobiia bacterium]|nr:restriction endonuclease subunit S [Acidimicrobiia bacterium]
MSETGVLDLKPYPEYKYSGVDWLGDIPSHWEVRRLGSLLQKAVERGRPDLPLLSVVRDRGVIPRDISDKKGNHNFIPDNLSNYKVVREGAFVMNKMKAWQGSYGVSHHIGLVSPAYYVFEISEVEPRYFHLAIRSKAYVPLFAQASDGVRIGQWDLSPVTMRYIPFAVPLLPEQNGIARFLDYVEGRLRRLIEAREG